jgi:hypothetical protein
MLLLQKASTNGAVCGHVFLKIIPDSPLTTPYPRIINISPEYVTVVTDPDDIDLVWRYVISYPARGVNGEMLVIKQTMERNDGGRWTIIDAVSENGGQWKTTATTLWPWAWAPLIDCQNLPSPNEYYGLADLEPDVLALNAAIQASMAGDSGRGFAVVADEVQRLAERSSAATKQIEALVKTIQTDTNEAVISMEQTTSEVVRGARLAQDAGVALEEIEKVSKTLAALIQNISNAARQQASSAGHISNTMNVIQEITSQTSSGTTATAKSIGNLAKMASEMRKSVSGFTLPGGEQA